MKITVKLPVGDGKLKLQSRGKIQGKQYKTGSGLMEGLDRILERKIDAFLRKESTEKIAINVKEYIGSHFETINETLGSLDKNYLLFATSCFLEDVLSKKIMKKYAKHD